MAQIKPAIDTVWGSTGSTTDPGTTKMNLGWTAEIPTHDVQNFWQQRADEMLTHINEQGIAVHDAVTDYPVDAWAKGSDGQVYKSLQTPNINQDPTTEAAFWTVAGFSLETASRTITIGAGSTYAQIQAAFDSVGKYIAPEVIITIEFDDDTYDIGANVLVVPDFSGAGRVLINASSGSTTPGGSAKAVNIQGDGVGWPGFIGGGGDLEMVMLFNSNSFVRMTDIKVLLDGASSSAQSAAVVCVGGNSQFQRCGFQNLGTSNTVNSAGIKLQLQAHATIQDTYINISGASPVATYCVYANDGSTVAANDLTGAGEQGYFAQDASNIAFTSNSIATTVTLSNNLRGEIYT